MPVYRHSFLTGKPHKSAYYVNAFFSVAVGECVVHGIVRFLHPFAVNFDVTHFFLVVIDFAYVVQKGDYRRTFGRNLFFGFLGVFHFQVLQKAVISLYAVFAKSACVSGMEFSGSGRAEKVALFQPFEKFSRAFSGNIFLKNTDKLRRVIDKISHFCSPSVN